MGETISNLENYLINWRNYFKLGELIFKLGKLAVIVYCNNERVMIINYSRFILLVILGADSLKEAPLIDARRVKNLKM